MYAVPPFDPLVEVLPVAERAWRGVGGREEDREAGWEWMPFEVAGVRFRGGGGGEEGRGGSEENVG